MSIWASGSPNIFMNVLMLKIPCNSLLSFYMAIKVPQMFYTIMKKINKHCVRCKHVFLSLKKSLYFHSGTYSIFSNRFIKGAFLLVFKLMLLYLVSESIIFKKGIFVPQSYFVCCFIFSQFCLIDILIYLTFSHCQQRATL